MLFLRLVKGNMEIWQWILVFSFLFPMAIKDFRTRKVNIYMCLTTMLIALFIRGNILGESDFILLLDLIPGTVLYFIAVLSREAVGKGDALILLFIGSVTGYRLELEAVAISLLLAGLLSLILFAMKKVDKKTEIPFVPFLSIGVLAGGLI